MNKTKRIVIAIMTAMTMLLLGGALLSLFTQRYLYIPLLLATIAQICLVTARWLRD